MLEEAGMDCMTAAGYFGMEHCSRAVENSPASEEEQTLDLASLSWMLASGCGLLSSAKSLELKIYQ